MSAIDVNNIPFFHPLVWLCNRINSYRSIIPQLFSAIWRSDWFCCIIRSQDKEVTWFWICHFCWSGKLYISFLYPRGSIKEKKTVCTQYYRFYSFMYAQQYHVHIISSWIFVLMLCRHVITIRMLHHAFSTRFQDDLVWSLFWVKSVRWRQANRRLIRVSLLIEGMHIIMRSQDPW